MIDTKELKKIYTPDEYYEHGEALLSERSDYYSSYLTWVNDNRHVLLKEYICLLVEGKEDILDSSFLEWAMTSYIVYDYNTVKSHIDTMLN